MTTDEALARLTREIADCRGQGYIDASLVRLSLGDVAQVLATNAALRDQLARVMESGAALLAADRAYRDLIGHPPETPQKVIDDAVFAVHQALEWHLLRLAASTPTPGAAGEVG